MKIGRAPVIFACVASCIVLACINVARADLGGKGTIVDAALRTVRNRQSTEDLAGGGLLHLYPSQQSEHKDVAEKPQRRKKRNFR
jgi:hypothetical protein